MTEGTSFSAAGVAFSPQALRDCDALGLSAHSVVDVVVADAAQYPRTYTRPFSALPLVFSGFVAEATCDGSRMTITAVLRVDRAHPATEAWQACASLYRQALALPYQRRLCGMPLPPTEATRTVSHFRRLVEQFRVYLLAVPEVRGAQEYGNGAYDAHLDEAEIELRGSETKVGVARLTYVLSQTHRMLYGDGVLVNCRD